MEIRIVIWTHKLFKSFSLIMFSVIVLWLLLGSYFTSHGGQKKSTAGICCTFFCRFMSFFHILQVHEDKKKVWQMCFGRQQICFKTKKCVFRFETNPLYFFFLKIDFVQKIILPSFLLFLGVFGSFNTIAQRNKPLTPSSGLVLICRAQNKKTQ